MKTQLLICISFIALCSLFSLVTSSEVEDETEFDYDEGGEKGPSRWGDIKPEWRLCKVGRMQSPIDLRDERVQTVFHLGKLQIKYHASNATLRNRGHDIQLAWPTGAGYLHINKIKYELQQIHWHTPSEHAINGKRFDLELHAVHETEAGETAVIAILYRTGEPDPFLSSLRDQLKAISGTSGEEETVGIVDPGNIKVGSSLQYYRYIGSLTTPPCSENVVWTVLREVRTVSKEQIDLLRTAVHDGSGSNARPLQPLNNRLVQLYKPKDSEED